MPNFYAQYPIQGGGGGGVTSLNGLTGALTLVAGTNITITPGVGTLTIDATGTSGANTFLSNLTSPTAINQDLLPQADNTLSIGSPTFRWNSVNTVSVRTQAVTAGAVALQLNSDVATQIAGSNSAIQGTLQIMEAATNGANYIGFTVPLALASDTLYTLPLDGTAGQVLSTDGAGILSWVTASGSGNIASINGDPTAAQTLSVGTAGTDFAIVDAGGGSHVFNLPTASAVNRGALSSADWTTFNNKFTLPALTAGSVLFSDGTTIAQDNTNFYWDDTGKTLALGGVFGPPGTVPYAQTSQRTVTDPSGIDGAVFGIHYSNNTVNNGSLNTSGYFEGRIQIDAGVTTSANAGVIFQAYRNNGASDAGTLQFLVGAFGGAHQTGTDPAALTDLVAGVLSQVDITNGQANRVADFYGLAGTNGGTINTGQFGIYIEPPAAGIKDNWLSGQALIGGSTYASHVETLKVVGDMSATTNVTDTGTAAGIFSATSNTTVSGSNTTFGIAGTVTALVQAGAVNDKAAYGMNFSTVRGDGTDDGNLSAMAGAIAIQQHNSGAAGTTDNLFGFANIVISQQGTITNVYDFFAQMNNAGGTVTNHYGVYINHDAASPVKNWLSGKSQFGNTSFVAPTSTIESYGPIGFMDSGFQISFVAPTLATSTAYVLPAADGTSGYVLTTDGAGNLSWMAAGAGSGANQSLSNLTSPTAINQDLIFAQGTFSSLKTKDDATTNTDAINVQSGIATGFSSGSANFQSGAADVNTGDVNIQSGNSGSSGGVSGSLNLQTGASVDTTTGQLNINTGAPSTANTSSGGIVSATGAVTGTGQSGIYQFLSGAAEDTASGSIFLQSGSINGTGTSGAMTFASGPANSTGGTGSLNYNSGTVADGTSGQVNIFSGDASGTGNTGDVSIRTGTVVSGTRGQIQFQDGTEGTAGYVWTSTDITGKGAWAPGAILVTNNKETFVLNGTDITNQYIDLAHVARTASIIFMVQGSPYLLEGASYDYSVNYTGGAGGNTRITFLNDLATGGGAALIAGDVVQVQYEY